MTLWSVGLPPPPQQPHQRSRPGATMGPTLLLVLAHAAILAAAPPPAAGIVGDGCVCNGFKNTVGKGGDCSDGFCYVDEGKCQDEGTDGKLGGLN